MFDLANVSFSGHSTEGKARSFIACGVHLLMNDSETIGMCRSVYLLFSNSIIALSAEHVSYPFDSDDMCDEDDYMHSREVVRLRLHSLEEWNSICSRDIPKLRWMDIFGIDSEVGFIFKSEVELNQSGFIETNVFLSVSDENQSLRVIPSGNGTFRLVKGSG